MLTATAGLQHRASRNPGATSCELRAGYESDDAQVSLGTLAGQIQLASLKMTVVDTVEAPVTARLTCTEHLSPGGAIVADGKIAAIRVATAHEG